jgi:branched-chain amino acid transport system permease protein
MPEIESRRLTEQARSESRGREEGAQSRLGSQRVLVATCGLVAVGVLLLPYLTANTYLLDLAILILLSIVQAEAWNLLGGYTGQISFGHAAFFGIGAYTSTILFLRAGLSPWAGMMIGGFLAAIVAWPLGWLTFRLRGPYFSLSTLAVAEVIRVIAFNWHQVTGGGDGLNILFSPGSARAFYYAAVALVTVALAVSVSVVRSRIGTYLKAIREDQDAAEAVGINTTRFKVIALMISAFLVALAGSFFASYRLYINPELVFDASVSLQMIFVTVAGGLGSLGGPVLGSLVLVPVSEYFRGLSPVANLLIYGLFVVGIMLFLPGGLLQLLTRTSAFAATVECRRRRKG